MEIDRAFRASGIEIAFPQQDIHVRSVETLMPLFQPSTRRKPDGDSQAKQVA
jgi:small-conductance mechanosensitive channel